jgi:hypothetical protein
VSDDRVPGEDSRAEEFVSDLLAQPSEGGANAVLRSIGTLLVTLGGAQRPAQRRRRARSANRPVRQAAPIPAELPEPALPEPPRFGGLNSSDDVVELLLSDARDRAHQVIEKSVEQARQILESGGSGSQMALIERLDQSVETLTREVGSFRGAVDGRLAGVEQRVVDVERGVTGVYNRLDRIESLLGAIARREAVSPTVAAAAPQAMQPPRTSPSEPRPRLPVTPLEPQAPPAPEISVPPTPPVPPVEPPPSSTPPLARPAAIELPAAAASEAAPVNPAETRFDPAGGALVVRVFPISGFQGLMRVQDALARVSTIRAATVETYAQGEARLRLQLGASIVSSELAAGVQARLGQQAIVRAASIADRSVLIVLE